MRELGYTGILVTLYEQGILEHLVCDMDVCYRPEGRGLFDVLPDPVPDPIPPWILTEDHFPTLRAEGGTLTVDNVRPAHRSCNQLDYGHHPGHHENREEALDEVARWLEAHRDDAALLHRRATWEVEWGRMRARRPPPHATVSPDVPLG